MTYKTATIKVLSNFVNWKEAEEYDVDENTTTRELITTVLHRHGMLSRDPNLFYLTLENRGSGADDPGLTLNLSDESLVMNYHTLHPSAHFAMHMRQGGLIKIHDESIMPGSYYKSLFISKRTTSREVVSLLLASYGKSEPPDNFALTEQNSKGKEIRQLQPSECPLLVDQSAQQTTIHLKRLRTTAPEKSTLSRSQTISSAQDLKRKTGISREATVVRLRESFRRLQRLRTDQEALEVEHAVPSSARLASKFALSEESLEGPRSARKGSSSGALGKISKKISSLTNIRSSGRSGISGTALTQDPLLLRSSGRSYGSLLPSAQDSLSGGLPPSSSSPRSSKRYSFPPSSVNAQERSPPLPHTADPPSSSPRSPRRSKAPLPPSNSSPRSPRRTAGAANSSPSRSPPRGVPEAVAAIAAAASTTSEATLAAATAAAVSHALSSPRAQRRYRSFHAGYPQSAREPRSSNADGGPSGSMSARGVRGEEWARPRLPVRPSGEAGGGGSAGGRRQLPQAPADDVEARRRLLALEAQRRLRLMAGGSRERVQVPSARPLATSPSRIQAKTRPSHVLDLNLRGLSDDSEGDPTSGPDNDLSPRKDSSLETVVEASSRRRISPRKSEGQLLTARRSEVGVQTDPGEVTAAARSRQITGHPALFDIVASCEVFTVRLDRASLWERFGLRCFEAIFPGQTTGEEPGGLVGPSGRKPLLGRAPGAFQAVNAQALASIRSLIAVDSLEPHSPAASSSSGASSQNLSLLEGDYLLEVNGMSVLSSTPQHVESLVNSFLTVEITAARARSRMRRSQTSADSTDGAQEDPANSDLERQLVSLRLKYSQLKAESRRNEKLISELRDVVARKVRVRVGGATRTTANSDATFRAIRTGYAEEVVSTV